jgi:hypothetical protein
MQLRAAITAKAAENVPGQAFGVRAQEYRLLRIDIPENQSKVVFVPKYVFVGI